MSTDSGAKTNKQRTVIKVLEDYTLLLRRRAKTAFISAGCLGGAFLATVLIGGTLVYYEVRAFADSWSRISSGQINPNAQFGGAVSANVQFMITATLAGVLLVLALMMLWKAFRLQERVDAAVALTGLAEADPASVPMITEDVLRRFLQVDGAAGLGFLRRAPAP